MAFVQLLFARVLFSLVTLGYGLVTIKADFNKTHATNPLWTGHARFHLVWQITSYLGFALLALALIWLPGPYALERLYLAGTFAGIVYGAFFIALVSMPLYGGRTFEHQHPGARGRSTDRRAAARDAESHDQDVVLVAPVGHGGGVDGVGNWGVHTCSCFT